MNEQEKKEWIDRNKINFDSENDAFQYLERRLAQEKAKADRILRVFVNIDAYHEYAETHNMGKDWDYDSDDFNGEYGPEFKDYVAVCAYEYARPN